MNSNQNGHAPGRPGTLFENYLQAEPGPNGKLRLLPTWPTDWDVSFKLHAPGQTVVEAVYRGGKFETLKVTPASRRKDLMMPQPSR